MDFLLEGILAITPQQLVMYVVGILLIWLAVKKEYEPALLLPMGFGAILQLRRPKRCRSCYLSVSAR